MPHPVECNSKHRLYAERTDKLQKS